MRNLFMYLVLLCIIVACNNNAKNPGGLVGEDDDKTKGGWNSKVRTKYLKKCADEGIPKEMCNCILGKLEKKYTPAEVEELTDEDGERLAKDCMGAAKDDVGGGGGDDNYDENITGEEKGNGARWTNQQRNQYIEECAGAAEKNLNYSSQQANSFCECMTRKVEKKHSYQQAARMSVEDFSTQEWENARADCRSDN